MKAVTYIENMRELSLCKELGVEDIILSHKLFSRFGKLDTKELISLSKEALKLGLNPIFEWDIIMTHNDFKAAVSEFDKLDLSNFKMIRVQDPGALNYIFEKRPEFQIQLNLENGNHNLVAVEAWANLLGKRLERVILSIELPKGTLAHYCKNLKVKVEFLALGRILLFYTPRNLLSSLLPEDDEKREKEYFSNRYIEAVGESEESPHKGFPLVENRHGTFMFHLKDHYLLDHMKDLKKTGIDFYRVDLRFGKDFDLLKDVIEIEKGAETTGFKEKYPSDVIRGFFHVNKSDVLFKKLKNTRITRVDESYIGEVIEASKGEFLGVVLKNPKRDLKVGDKLRFITPVGKEVFAPVVFLKNASLEDIESVSNEKLVFMNYVGSAWVKSQVYFE